MVTSDVKVRCSGALLSTLLYEQLRCCHMQEGFLLGQVNSHIREHISDSQICNEETETTINLTGILPCTTLGCFYSGAGRVNQDKLKSYLGSNFKNVIGWYRSRGSNCDDIYLRETRVHHQLDELMTHAGGNFIIALISYTPCGTSGTLALSHKFLVLRNRSFESVALEVVNMSDTSTSDYIMEVNNPSIYSSAAVQHILSTLKTPEPGVSEADALHSGLLSKLQELLPTYASTQESHHQILQEVIQLRALCYSNGITPDFTPSNIMEENLITLEDETSASLNVTGKKSKSKSPSRVSGKKRLNSKNKESVEIKTIGDPFGFVNTEMEKLQVKTKPAGKKLGKSFSDVALQPGSDKNHNPGTGLRGSPRKTSATVNPRSSSVYADSESPPSSPNRLRSKSARPSVENSRHSQSPNRITRGRNPSNTTPTKVKSKVKEAWARKATDSQEF